MRSYTRYTIIFTNKNDFNQWMIYDYLNIHSLSDVHCDATRSKIATKITTYNFILLLKETEISEYLINNRIPSDVEYPVVEILKQTVYTYILIKEEEV